MNQPKGIAFLTGNNSIYKGIELSKPNPMSVTLEHSSRVPISVFGEVYKYRYRRLGFPFGKTFRGLKKYLKQFGFTLRKRK